MPKYANAIIDIPIVSTIIKLFSPVKVYRASEMVKPMMRMEFNSWKDKARKQLKLYRENKITSEELCNWLDKNK